MTSSASTSHRLDEPGVAFFWAGGPGRTMVGLWETRHAPNAMRLHIAFACALSDVLAASERLRHLGIVPKGFDGEPVSEPVVTGWMPAASHFFTDLDGHLLEYVAMLAESPRPGVGVVSYSAWQSAV